MKNTKLISLILLFLLPQFVFPNTGSKALIQNLRVKNIKDCLNGKKRQTNNWIFRRTK